MKSKELSTRYSYQNGTTQTSLYLLMSQRATVSPLNDYGHGLQLGAVLECMTILSVVRGTCSDQN